MNKNNRWYEVAKAWVEGAKIESRYRFAGQWTEWSICQEPLWYTDGTFEYRVKPTSKPDHVKRRYVAHVISHDTVPTWSHKPDKRTVHYAPIACVDFIFDGKANRLKEVKIIDPDV